MGLETCSFSHTVTLLLFFFSLADGVEKAAIVCCFLTSDYEKSEECKLELKYAHKRHKRIVLCIFNDMIHWQQSKWLKSMIDEFEHIEFRDISKSNIHSKVRELIVQINEQTRAREWSQSQSLNEPTYLFELIKYDYMCNSTIERFMNQSKSFPIEQAYINLAIVETKEHQDKENKLRGTQNIDAVMHTFEEIHGSRSRKNTLRPSSFFSLYSFSFSLSPFFPLGYIFRAYAYVRIYKYM
jgi:hypothetical protein